MMENNITMSNNEKGGEVSAYAFTKAKNTLEITLKVNPEKLIGKTYKEMTELLLKAVIGSNVSVQGALPFPMEYGKYYDINQEGIIKRASVDEFNGLIVALDVPFIQTDNPTLDSIMAPEPPEDDDDEYYFPEDLEDDEYYDTPFNTTDSEYMKEHSHTTVGEYLEDVDRDIKDMEFSLGGYIDYEYEERILHYSDHEMIYINDAIGVELTEDKIRSSIIGNIAGNRISIYPTEE